MQRGIAGPHRTEQIACKAHVCESIGTLEAEVCAKGHRVQHAKPSWRQSDGGSAWPDHVGRCPNQARSHIDDKGQRDPARRTWRPSTAGTGARALE